MPLHHEAGKQWGNLLKKKKSQAYSALNVAQVITQASLEWEFWIKGDDSLK